jgi:hypothetical protein
MPEKYRRPREYEMRQTVERMQLAWEAERDALATVHHFNAWLSAADSDEAGRAFQSEAGRCSELMPARYSDAKPATWCVARAGRLV